MKLTADKKVRILTYHYIHNNGAFLFVFALVKYLQSCYPGIDVKIVDYKAPRLALHEFLKRFKLFRQEPFFYARRSKIYERLIKNHLPLDQQFFAFSGQKRTQPGYAQKADALMTGMDVWCIINNTPRPLFPNIYWLPEKMDIPKLAYGVSAYFSDRKLVQSHAKEITNYLNDFEVIGARDRFTHEMVMQYRTRQDGLVEWVPDPTLLVDIPEIGRRQNLAALGFDPNRPILGLLLYGKSRLSEELCTHYRQKGYQIAALSMYNPDADVNLGHVLDPFEWAAFFKTLSFCVTDRFHGSLFCIKNQVPFVSIESENIPADQSKLFDLLSQFDLTNSYTRLDDAGLSVVNILGKIKEIEMDWVGLKPAIAAKIDHLKEQNQTFMEKMKNHL